MQGLCRRGVFALRGPAEAAGKCRVGGIRDGEREASYDGDHLERGLALQQ